MSMTSCAIRFEANRDYLLYTGGGQMTATSMMGEGAQETPFPSAWKDLGKLPVYVVGGCDPTRIVEPDDPELAYLRAGPKGDGWIEGRVVQNYPTYSFRDAIPVRDAVLSIRAPGFENTVPIGADGTFRVGSVPPGTPTVTIRSETLGVAKLRSAVRVPPGGCAVVNASFETNSTISGKVIGPDGKPAAGIRVELGELRSSGKPHVVPQTWANTDERGDFEISNVPVAPVVLAANLNGAPSTRMPFDPVYVPGVQELSAAQVFRVPVNSVVAGVTLQLPRPLPFRTLYVDVVWPDGSAAIQGARATAEFDGARAAFEDAPEATNRVALSLALGRIYDIEADWLNWDVGRPMLTVDGMAPVKVNFTQDGQVVQLKLRASRPK
jgi:hypothetical protein